VSDEDGDDDKPKAVKDVISLSNNDVAIVVVDVDVISPIRSTIK
jgi:hypothetical protein